MRVTIKYCGPCGYEPVAKRLADRLRQDESAAVRLVRGSLGVFKIWVDDRLVFDKRRTNGLLGKLGFGKLEPDDRLLARIERAKREREGGVSDAAGRDGPPPAPLPARVESTESPAGNVRPAVGTTFQSERTSR